MPEAHVRLANLYAGRTDLWGAVHGEQIKRPLTDQDWYEHVHGDGSVGVYPLVQYVEQHPGGVGVQQWWWSVKWCGVDIDEGDEQIAIAINVHKALRALGITAWIERSKGKGYHVLAFLSEWVPAATARNAMLFACQVANYQPKEVYPKQTSLEEGQAGNYLNAAYAKQWADKGRRVMLKLDPVEPIPLEAWLDMAEASLTPPSVIAKASAMYREPPPPKPVLIARPSVDPTPRLRGVARKLYEEGPLPDLGTGRIDRSAALQRLAHLLRADGFSAGEAYHLVADLDSRLGKYVGRRDADVQYQKLIERAYG